MASTSSKLFLGIHLTPLHPSRAGINVSLPSRCTKILDTAWGAVIEDFLDFLKGFLAGFGEDEEDVDEH